MSGLKQAVGRIPAVAPLPSLLSSARPLPDGVDWSSGIAWTPGCAVSARWPRCPGDVEKPVAVGPGPAVATVPFTILTPVACERVTGQMEPDLDALARDLTEVHTAWGLAGALWMGDGLDDDVDSLYGLPPTLRRVAEDVSIGGVDSPLDDAVAALLHAYSACTGGSGGAVLHVPDVLMVSALGGGDGGARVAVQEGNVYRGPMGAILSPGPGYPHGASAQGADGHGPLVDTDPEVYKGNAYDEVWVYVSGPVEYAVGPVELPNSAEERHLPARLNRYEAIGERDAIVRFDPCCVFAALATNAAGELS